MEILLRLKHWQVFIPTFGIMLAFLILQMISEFGNILNLYSFGIDFIMLTKIITLISVGSTVAFICWSWVAGLSLMEKRPYDNYNENLFKSGLAFQVFHSILNFIILPLTTLRFGELNSILTFISMAAGLYADYVVIKVLTSVEKDRETKFGEFVGDFLLLVFYPIGIWWLQPRINRIFDKEAITVNPDAPLDQSIKVES